MKIMKLALPLLLSLGFSSSALAVVLGGATCQSESIYGACVGIGLGANAGYRGIAIGREADANGAAGDSIAIGNFSQSRGLHTIALGHGAQANNWGSVAIGAYSTTDREGQVSFGRPGEERVLSNVAAGTQAHDAVIYQQVVPAITGIVSGLGGGATYNPATGVMTAPSYVLEAGTFDNVGDALLAIEAGSGGGTDPLAMRYDDASKSTTTLEGAAGTQVKNVADGTDAMDAVNKRQLDLVDTRVSDTRSALATNTSYFGGGASYDPATGIMTPPNWSFRDGTNHSNAGSAFDNLDARLYELEQRPPSGPGTPGPQGPTGATGADGRSAYQVAVDNGFVGTQAEWLESLHGADGRDGEDGNAGSGSNVAAGDNIEVETNEDGTQTVSLADNIQLSDEGSLTVGGTTVNANGVSIEGGPSMTRDGIDAGGQRITSVANGRIERGSTDAVNGGQIYDLQNNWNDRWTETNTRIDQLSDDVQALGAQSAAMSMMTGAGTYLPVGKVAVSAGVGFYGNKAAFAVGLKARASERSSWSIGVSISPDGRPMGGVGYSYTFGQ
ncbi:MAG: YadA-like family protein [Aquabacterium sp.]|nr:YadA-like family protein [Aquabacterium sp.]